MAEPAHTASGIVIATGAITLSGSIFGLQYDALLFGLFGGLISLMHLAPMSLARLAGTLASAALTGALFGPAAVAAAAASWAWMAAVPATSARLGAALCVGIFIQAIIPLALGWIEQRGQGGPSVPMPAAPPALPPANGPAEGGQP